MCRGRDREHDVGDLVAVSSGRHVPRARRGPVAGGGLRGARARPARGTRRPLVRRERSCGARRSTGRSAGSLTDLLDVAGEFGVRIARPRPRGPTAARLGGCRDLPRRPPAVPSTQRAAQVWSRKRGRSSGRGLRLRLRLPASLSPLPVAREQEGGGLLHPPARRCHAPSVSARGSVRGSGRRGWVLCGRVCALV